MYGECQRHGTRNVRSVALYGPATDPVQRREIFARRTLQGFAEGRTNVRGIALAREMAYHYDPPRGLAQRSPDNGEVEMRKLFPRLIDFRELTFQDNNLTVQP